MTSEAEYIENHSIQADEVLNRVERWAALHTAQPQMVCGSHEGALLTILCRSLSARRVVEVGTFVGYSTICLARGLSKEGIVHTFEINEELESRIVHNLESAAVSDRVRLHIGDARRMIPQVLASDPTPVDMVFVDADKRGMEEYYEMLLPYVRKGGLIVIDNVLWGRKVLDTERYHDCDTMLIDSFNKKVEKDERVENVMIGMRDGLMVCSVL